MSFLRCIIISIVVFIALTSGFAILKEIGSTFGEVWEGVIVLVLLCSCAIYAVQHWD